MIKVAATPNSFLTTVKLTTSHGEDVRSFGRRWLIRIINSRELVLSRTTQSH